MKNLIIILLFFMFLGCSGPGIPPSSEAINTKFFVTEVYKAKYSRVEGYIFYNGIQIPADNGSSGYYYKEYYLKPGDVIVVYTYITKEYTENGVTLYTSDLNLDQFTN